MRQSVQKVYSSLRLSSDYATLVNPQGSDGFPTYLSTLLCSSKNSSQASHIKSMI